MNRFQPSLRFASTASIVRNSKPAPVLPTLSNINSVPFEDTLAKKEKVSIEGLRQQYKNDPHSLQFQAVNPKLLYRNSMRTVRRKYLLEQQQLQKELKELKEQERAKSQENERVLRQDIQRYKQEKQLSSMNLGLESDRPNPVDVMRAEQQKSATTQDSLSSEFKMMVQQRQKLWSDLNQKIKEIKFDNHCNTLHQLGLKRQQHLLHLYFSARNFITYDNLEQKLDNLFQYGSTGTSRGRRRNPRATAGARAALLEKILVDSQN